MTDTLEHLDDEAALAITFEPHLLVVGHRPCVARVQPLRGQRSDDRAAEERRLTHAVAHANQRHKRLNHTTRGP